MIDTVLIPVICFFISSFIPLQVVDWTNTWSACSRLPCANLKNITHRIGFLLLFNPMFVEGTYELDLSDRSHAIITRVLVDLSVKEPGENWVDETFNGRPFELPATWVGAHTYPLKITTVDLY
jgi:hypothetical protein